MADSIATPSFRIKSKFCKHLTADVIFAACDQAAHRWRKRKFDPVLTIHLFVLQVLHGNTAILHLRHLVGHAVNAAAYCKARMRIPLAVYETLLDHAARLAAEGCAPVLGAMRVYLVDASSTLTPDTPAVRKLFQQPKNIKPGCGFPMAKVLALFDAASGAILRPLICSLFVHEASNVWLLHPLLAAGDLIVGDRAFCSYAHLTMLHARGVFGLFRMQQRQKVDFRRGRRCGGRGRPKSRFIQKLGSCDQLVEWFKPKVRPKWMSKKQFEELPASLIVRELRYHLKANGQRTRIVTIATTLTDPALYPAEKVAAVYGLRWQVETHFGQLKTSMKMARLKCQSADGVKKELLTYFIAYNLTRVTMREAAERQGVTPGRISFIDALRWLSHASEDQALIVLAVIPLRSDRHEPRVKKYLKYRYRPMTRPRHILKKRPYLYADKAK